MYTKNSRFVIIILFEKVKFAPNAVFIFIKVKYIHESFLSKYSTDIKFYPLNSLAVPPTLHNTKWAAPPDYPLNRI